MTALLFDIGKVLIGFYIGRSSIGSVFGAAQPELLFWRGSIIHRS